MAKVEVKMPQIGESVIEGTIIEWVKKEGDYVKEDETLLEIGTDKVDTEIPSPCPGVLVKILAKNGDIVAVNSVIAIIETKDISQDSLDLKSLESTSNTEDDLPPRKKLKKTEDSSNKITETPRIDLNDRFLSPLVRSIATKEEISLQELSQISGSGKDNRITKKDILSYIENKKDISSKPVTISPQESDLDEQNIESGHLNIHSPASDVEIIKMDRMRKMIAQHMVKSKQTSAHVTTFSEVDVTNIVNWRQTCKLQFQKSNGVKLTYTPIFLQAIIQTVQKYPLINSSIIGDEIHMKRDINFGIAVALGESGEGGLIVPVIKKAQDLNLAGLAKSLHILAKNARNKQLNPDDLVEGTITLTNYGSVGNLMGTPIINQPQVAIIGTGAIQKRLAVMETDEGDVIAIRSMMYLSLSYDHRLIDGAYGGAFLNAINKNLRTIKLTQ